MLTAVVYSTNNQGEQEEVCRLTTDENGRIVPSVRHSSGLAVLNSPLINPETGRKVTRDDGNAFLRLLPSAYSGTRLRVGLEMDGVKGDLPGHPFRGNQWSGGQGREVRTFPTEASARDWLESNMKVDLTEDERQARDEYITSGHWNINKLARGKEIGESDVGRVQKRIDDLDSIIRKSTLPEDVVAYRGIRTSLVNELFGDEGPKVGDVMKDKGFASTGIIPSPRSSWIIRMTLPAGSHAMYGSNPEAELVLARGSKFKVTKITEGVLDAPQAPRHQAPLGDMKIIDVEVSW